MYRFFCLAVVLALPIVSYSQPSDKLLRKGEKGNAKAQCQLGDFYLHQSDTTNALVWFSKAANQSYEDAYYDLARISEEQNNYDEAAKWWKKIHTIHTDAVYFAFKLGDYYMKGKGSVRSYHDAIYWYEKAIVKEKKTIYNRPAYYNIENRSQEAMINIAECYDSIGNYKSAEEWYVKADTSIFVPMSNQGIRADAIAALIRIHYLELCEIQDSTYLNRLIKYFCNMRKAKEYAVESFLSSEKSKDNKMALFWLNMAINLNSKRAEHWYALALEYGLYGLEPNSVKAFNLYKKLYKEKYEPAYLGYARMYEKGIGTKEDDAFAFKLYEWIAKNGNYNVRRAKGRLGVMIYYGKGTKFDRSEAFEKLNEAAQDIWEWADGEGMRTLSQCYRYEIGTKVDIKLANYWADLAEEWGDDVSIELAKIRSEAECMNGTVK